MGLQPPTWLESDVVVRSKENETRVQAALVSLPCQLTSRGTVPRTCICQTLVAELPVNCTVPAANLTPILCPHLVSPRRQRALAQFHWTPSPAHHWRLCTYPPCSSLISLFLFGLVSS